MKKIKSIWIVCGFVISLSACVESIPRIEHDMELSAIHYHDSVVFDSIKLHYEYLLSRIDKSLDKIRDEQGELIIGKNSNADIGVSKSEQIFNNLRMMEHLLANNKKRIHYLEYCLKKVKGKNTSFIVRVDSIKNNLLEENILYLTELLNEKEKTIKKKNEEIFRKSVQIEELKDELLSQKTGVNKEIGK